MNPNCEIEYNIESPSEQAGAQTILGAALASVQSGVPVIPCLAILDTATGRWRRPALPGLERGTRDLSEIHKLFSSPEAASYLLGLRFADKGWVVLDVPAGVPIPQELPPTRTVRTPSGGRQLYYIAPAGAEPDCDIYDTDTNITVPATHVVIPPSPGYVFEDDREPVPLPLAAARRLYADADAEDLAERPAKARTRFGGLNASQGSVLPEIDYWDAERLLPRIPGEGCVGYMIGDTGSHKTGTAIMLALNAIEEKGARVLYIAAEGGRGVQTKRVPKAWRARGQELAMLDPYWCVETADFDLTSAQDRRELAAAYASFTPDLVFIDVMTLVAGGANINETKDATALRAAAADLARRFGGATIVLIHHPNKQGMKADSAGIGSGSGSATLYQLAYFQLDVRYEEKRGVVRLYVWKMKDEERGRWVFFKNAAHAPRSPLANGVPVIRRMTAEEAREYDGKADGPPPDVAAENSTSDQVIASLAEDVARHLKGLERPMLLRDFARQMMERDPMHLKQAQERLSTRDAETLTPDQVRERCLGALIKRLTRAIGSDTVPGELYPFIEKGAGGKLPKKDRRFQAQPARQS
jgi:AAA domain/Bifunctional DNA primase/polymerase, N-terminal